MSCQRNLVGGQEVPSRLQQFFHGRKEIITGWIHYMVGPTSSRNVWPFEAAVGGAGMVMTALHPALADFTQ